MNMGLIIVAHLKRQRQIDRTTVEITAFRRGVKSNNNHPLADLEKKFWTIWQEEAWAREDWVTLADHRGSQRDLFSHHSVKTIFQKVLKK